MKDVQRIESFRKIKNFERGYAILLTSDKLYEKVSNRETFDENFRLINGRIKTGELKWTKINVKTERENPIKLQGEYKIERKKYSDCGEKNGEFKYCLIEIEKQNTNN